MKTPKEHNEELVEVIMRVFNIEGYGYMEREVKKHILKQLQAKDTYWEGIIEEIKVDHARRLDRANRLHQ